MNSRIRLDSWKSIASFLGCDVKTAQRWEKTRGLPVRRIPGGGRGSIFAYDDELEAWRHGLGSELDPGPLADSEEVKPGSSRRAILYLGVAGAAAGLAALAGRKGHFLPASRPESLALKGQLLTALDGRGGICWEHRFARPLKPLDAQEQKRRLHLVDWRRDGHPGAVFIGAHPLGGRNVDGADEILYRFGPDGQLQPPVNLAPNLTGCDGRLFDPGWLMSDAIVTGSSDQPPILWLALVSYLRYASAVVTVGELGPARVQFANPGHVQALCELTAGQGRLVAAAGVNNAADRTFLAVIGQQDPPSASPEIGAAHYCYRNAPNGSVRAYALLPPSEYNLLFMAAYSHVLLLYSAGGIIVLTLHQGAAGGAHYTVQFASDLTPIRALHRGSEPHQHAELEARKLVGHSYARCPERLNPMVIRRWTSSQGWREFTAPWLDEQKARQS